MTIICSSTDALAQPPNPVDEKGQQKYETNLPIANRFNVGDKVIYNKIDAVVINKTAGKIFPDEPEHITYKIRLKDGQELLVNDYELELNSVKTAPFTPVVDDSFKVGDYVELKDGRQGTIKSVVKVPAVGTPELITYEINVPVWVNSTSVVKKFDAADADEAVPPPPPEPASPDSHLLEAIQQLYNSLDQLSFRVSQLEKQKDQ